MSDINACARTCQRSKARPHPGPLLQGEGESWSVIWRSGAFLQRSPPERRWRGMERITKQTRTCYSLSLGERVRVRASQNSALLFHLHFVLVKARPHPGPLPQGEGESSSVTWRSGAFL